MIVPAYTFPATANVVELCGAPAVLVDVDPDTFNVDVAARRRRRHAAHEGRARRPPVRPAGRVGGAADRGPAGGRPRRGRGRRARSPLPRHALRVARRDGLPLVPSAQDRDDGRGRGGHDRRGGARRRGSAPSPPRHRAARRVDIPAPGLNYRLPDLLCAIGIPQLARLEQLLAARERVAGWYTERLEHLVLTPVRRRGRPPRLAGVRRPARPPRRGAATRCARRASRCRSAPMRSTTSAPYRDAGLVPGRRPRVRARARAPVRDHDDRGRGRPRRRRPRAVREPDLTRRPL